MTLEKTTARTPLAHTITVYTPDKIGDKIIQQGFYEGENLALLLRLLHHLDDPVVLDIGANIGNHSLAFSTAAKTVVAFEPMPRALELLYLNKQQNNIENIIVQELALSDASGTDTFHVYLNGNLGESGFVERDSPSEEIHVTKKRGDDVVQDLGIKQVDFIKLDVETHEAFVLEGLMQTIETHLPFITMEWNDTATRDQMRGSRVMKSLEQHYHFYVLGSNYDRGYWAGSALAFLRRKLTRMLKPRTAVLYPFDPDKIYRNLLLVPKHREQLISSMNIGI